MKLFKTADEKLAEIGFKKLEDDLHVFYQRNNQKYGYVHNLDLVHKASGRHIIQSYQESDGQVVGLTMYEAKLCLQKAKEKGWRVSKHG